MGVYTNSKDDGKVHGHYVIVNKVKKRSQSPLGMIFSTNERFQYCTKDTDYGYRPYHEYTKSYDKICGKNAQKSVVCNDVEMEALDKMTSDFLLLNMGSICEVCVNL